MRAFFILAALAISGVANAQMMQSIVNANVAAPPPAGPLIAATQMTGLGPNGTSSSINTTGATFLICHASLYSGAAPGLATVSDSKSNTYTALTSQTSITEGYSRLYYVANPTVGSGHTFTITGGTAYTVTCAAFNGVATSSPFDVENGNAPPLALSVCSTTTGGVTPSVNGALVISGQSNNAATATPATIDTGFTTVVTPSVYQGGDHEAGGMAYFVQTTAAAINPTWTYGASADCATTLGAFKP